MAELLSSTWGKKNKNKEHTHSHTHKHHGGTESSVCVKGCRSSNLKCDRHL